MTYRGADIFILPFREEGLSPVQARGLACGLVPVCTDRSGSDDLAEFLENSASVAAVKPDDAAALSREIEPWLAIAKRQSALRAISGRTREQFSSRAYGRGCDAKLAGGTSECDAANL